MICHAIEHRLNLTLGVVLVKAMALQVSEHTSSSVSLMFSNTDVQSLINDMGGLLMILGSLGEWVVGNTFPFVVFGSFGMSSTVLHTCVLLTDICRCFLAHLCLRT